MELKNQRRRRGAGDKRHSTMETKCGVEFHNLTRSALRIRRKVRNGSVLTEISSFNILGFQVPFACPAMYIIHYEYKQKSIFELFL